MSDVEHTAGNYHTRVVDDPGAIDGAAWNALLDAQAAPSPFMRHEYLQALHASGSAVAGTGWTPCFVTLQSEGALQAGVALYLKTHSYGEYVFDWAWADAYRRHGMHYYPKLLAAVPFTPVPGTRLLARDERWRARLIESARRVADERGLSSAHALFVDDVDAQALERAGWMLRHNVQFHWRADALDPAPDFATFLARLQRDKRKKIQQERRRVAEQGISFTVHEGAGIDTALWDFFHHCYTLTYRAHHSTPYLTRDFFTRVGQTMPSHWVMFVAHARAGPVAASLVAIDPLRRVAYGRYWGALRFVPCLHFEACYYQPLQWCIARRYLRFEGGAQGEHKMARGLLPVRTTSAHWLRDPRFSAAVAEFLAAEGDGVEQYVDELTERSPYKGVAGPPA